MLLLSVLTWVPPVTVHAHVLVYDGDIFNQPVQFLGGEKLYIQT